MLTRKKFFRIFLTLCLLLPLGGTAMGQKAETKTKYKRVIPWVQVPTKCETFEEFAADKKPAQIKAQFWKALGAKKPEEQLFADVKKLITELHITKDGKRVTSATLEEAQKIVWDNYCFERMMSQRLRYLCCFWPFEDEKQAFFIDFQHKYSTAKPETRAKIDADTVTFFIKQAAKENLTFADWELREAMMQHICCRMLLQQMESKKPGKLTDKDLTNLIREQAEEITLEYAEKEVNLSDVYTDWEITDTIIRFKNTMLINCMVDNVPVAEITKLGFDMTTSQAEEHLGAQRFHVSQVQQHVAEMQRMLAKVGMIDRAIRASLVLGDKPVLVMLGEFHNDPMSCNLEFCLMKVIMKNGPLVYFPETGENVAIATEGRKSDVYTKFFWSGIHMNIHFCSSLKLDIKAVDSSTFSVEHGFIAQAHARSMVMVEKMCEYLLSPHGKAERVAVGIFGNAHLDDFREPQMENLLKKASVPISVDLYYRGKSFKFDNRSEHPTVLKEIRVWDILRRLSPESIEAFVKTFCTDNDHPLAWNTRACNNVDVFANKSMRTLRGNSVQTGGMTDKEIQNRDETREKMLTAWKNASGLEVSSGKKSESDYGKAIQEYTEAIQHSSHDHITAAYYKKRGDVYREKGELDKAIDDYTEAIRLRPDYEWDHDKRGDAYREKGEYDKAIADYTTLLQRYTERAPVYHKRGLAYEKKGEMAKAKADFDRAKKLGLPID